MKFVCGSLVDAAHPYERIRPPPAAAYATPPRPHPAQLGSSSSGKKTSVRHSRSGSELDLPPAWLGHSPRTISERFNGGYSRPHNSGNDDATPASKHQAQEGKSSKKKEKKKNMNSSSSSRTKIGVLDVLMGYHSLLQGSSPLTSQRQQLHPTVGFVRNNPTDS